MTIDGKSVKVNCEMLVPTPGLPDFIIFKDSVSKWDLPFEKVSIDEETKAKILEQIITGLEKMGRVVQVE